MVRHVVNNSSFGFSVVYVELEQNETVGHVGAVVGRYSAVGLLLHWRKGPERLFGVSIPDSLKAL